jgi:hypothetical protein
MLIMLTTKVCSTTAAMAAGGIMALRKKTAAAAIATDMPGKLQHFIVCQFVWFVLQCTSMQYYIHVYI